MLRAVALTVALALTACGGAGESDVRVPGVRSADFEFAYQRLHDAGLRVRIERPLSIASLCSPTVRAQAPAGGAWVPRGTVVTLEPQGCIRGSPAVTQVSAVVPDFAGEVPSRAAEWASSHHLFFELRLPPLGAGDAPSFFENFRVVRQHPAPGAVLRPGVRVGAGFRPTPVVVHAQGAR